MTACEGIMNSFVVLIRITEPFIAKTIKDSVSCKKKKKIKEIVGRERNDSTMALEDSLSSVINSISNKELLFLILKGV